MRKPEFYAAVYAIIENEKGEILFMKRQNTGFNDGNFQVPAGHLEGEETVKYGFIREMEEELGIKIEEKDCEIKHISHRVSKQNNGNNRVYFDYYLKMKKYSGEIKNTEPEKCSELIFIDIDNISEEEKDLFGYDVEIIQKIKKGKYFSEVVMK